MILDTDNLQKLLQARKVSSLSRVGWTPSAVLLALFRKQGEDHILFTERTQKVEHHKGQISLPGGARDPEDDDLLRTALRESQEEMGINPRDVKVLGVLDDVPTGTRYIITPFVGVIPYPYAFSPFAEEIAEVIEAPISALVASKRPRRGPASMRTGGGNNWEFEYNGHIIWGATAQIIIQFLGLVGR